jgi:hypothetical protein
MGKASSSKKVARAARAGGGRVKGLRQRNLLFPGAVGAIVVLGVGLVGYAWNDRQGEASSEPPALGDHWHAAYGVYVCDQFVPATSDTATQLGIHSHGDNVIHIHPHSANATGDDATMGLFLDELARGGFELTDDSLTVNDETYTEGEQECDGEAAELVVAQWKDVQTSDRDPALITRDFDEIRFRDDAEGYTIAFVPEGTTDIPKPESAAQLAELGAVDAGDVTSTTTAGGGGGQGEGGGEGQGSGEGQGGTPTTAPAGSPTTAPAGEPSATAPAAPSTTAPEAAG